MTRFVRTGRSIVDAECVVAVCAIDKPGGDYCVTLLKNGAVAELICTEEFAKTLQSMLMGESQC